MTRGEATEFIRPAVRADLIRWADLGAGSGTFTEALAHLLPAHGSVLAVDRDSTALRSLRRLAARLPESAARVTVADGDVSDLERIPELAGLALDGALLANVLHFFVDASSVLGQVAERLTSSGRIVVVEYDGATPSRWVPHPLSWERLQRIAREQGFAHAAVVSTRPSRFRQAPLYCAVLERGGTGAHG